MSESAAESPVALSAKDRGPVTNRSFGQTWAKQTNCTLIISFTALATAVSGQQLGFEVATVKPAAPNDPQNGVIRDIGPGRISYRNMTLRDLLYQAYGSGLSTAMNVSGGPAWIARDRFTIEAIAQGNPDDRQFV